MNPCWRTKFETLKESMLQLKGKHFLEWTIWALWKASQDPFWVSGGILWRLLLMPEIKLVKQPPSSSMCSVSSVCSSSAANTRMVYSHFPDICWDLNAQVPFVVQQSAVQVPLCISMLTKPMWLLFQFYSIPSQWQESRSENNVRNINPSLEKKQ